jgi:hypothetical protein
MAGTLVADNLIVAARDASPTYDDRRHPDAVLLRALSRYQKELLGRIIRLDPSKAVEYFDQALPLTVFANGIAVPAYKYPLGAQVTYSGGTDVCHLTLVQWADNLRYSHGGDESGARACYLLNGILFLCGEAEDWTEFSSLRWRYVAEPAALAMSRATVLTLLPDSAEGTLVAYLALKMAQRGGAEEGEPKPDAASAAADWQVAEDRFFDEMGRNTQAVSSIIADNS